MKRSFTRLRSVCPTPKRRKADLLLRLRPPQHARIDDDATPPFMRAKRARALSRDTSKSVRDTPLARLGSQSPGCSTAASSSAFWHAECSPGSVDIIVTVGVALVGGGLVPVAPLPTLLAVVLAFLVLRLSTKPPSAILLMVAMLVLLANAGRAWRTLSS